MITTQASSWTTSKLKEVLSICDGTTLSSWAHVIFPFSTPPAARPEPMSYVSLPLAKAGTTQKPSSKHDKSQIVSITC
ncbi:hypothetical protein CEXT_293061 [Caerostris extrusa]|uniref:Uncharacterized protein n=1 Tax=Caerostris extrusa TaxID=172846 RepID=A0AAV4WL37_CAEEX|nr:hypothetical protein CEXT_293061 [Caerostris extrusa]